MAYYVGTREFASLYDAIDYAGLTNSTITSEPVRTDGGMLTMPDDTITSSPTGDVIVKEEPTTTATNEVEPAPAPEPAPELESETPTETTTAQYYITDPRYTGSIANQHGLENGGYTQATSTTVGGSFVDYSSVPVIQVGIEGLRDYYNSQPQLQNLFGSFDRFESYSSQYSQLLENHIEEYGEWWVRPEPAEPPTDEEIIAQYRANNPELADVSDEAILDIYAGAQAAEAASASVISYILNPSVPPLGGIDQAAMTAGGAIIDTDNPMFEGTLSPPPESLDPNSLQAMFQQEGTLGGYSGFAYSPEVQALNEQFGLTQANTTSVFRGEDGDLWQSVWNGSGFVTKKVNNIDDSLGLGDIARLGFSVALTLLGTPALSSALSSTLGAVGANAAASSIINVATQLITTGEIDIRDALQAGATSVLTGAALDAIEESGIYDSLQEAVGGTTTDQLLDADGNVVGEVVRNSAGEVISSTGVSANEWYTYATELGGVIQEGQTIAEQLSTVLDVAPDWLYDAGFETAEAINNAFEEAGTGIGTGAGAGNGTGEGVSTIPVVDGVRDIFAGDAEQVEQVEEPEEVPREEDILADTTQEVTGFEEGTITEDILGEYLEPIRADITASEQRIISQTQEFLANALANLPPNISQEELRTIVEEIVANAPQAETLSEDQVDVLVNSAVDSVRVDLETAETERQEIRAGQEAIRSELSSDIQSLEERLNSLPPEIREIVSEQLENLEITDDISSVRQEVTALEEVVSNIQPGTTPEQVAEQIEQADLVTSEELETTAEGLFAAIQAMAEGQTVELTTAQSELLAEITEGDAEVIERLSQYQGQLEDYLEERDITFDTVTDELSSDIERLQQQAEEFEQQTGERITGLEERMDANAIEQLAQLTGLRVEFLEGISNVEAAAIASSQGLSDQITEEITGIRGETAAQIEGMSERLTERINEYEAQTGEQLEMAAEERAVLGGQLGTLTSDVARVAEDVIRANGRIEDMDAESRQRYDELGLSIEELSLRVGVNLEALQEGMLTQEAAMRELIEETAQQTEERVGVQITGLGEQIAGIGEGVTGLGQALGIGLLGLAGAQPTAQEIAAAMPRQPVEFDPFLKGLSPFQPLTPLSLSPIQEKDATSELNKFIGRQTGMLV